MKDEHVHFDEEGVQWKRVFTVPTASVGTKIDPFNQNQFVRAGENKNLTVGDAWDASSEASQKRADLNGGVDPVRAKALDTYSKERKGAKHPSELPKIYTNKHVSVEY